MADTLANRITAIPQAMTRTTPAPAGGTTVAEGDHLKEPLGLVIAPNGDIITTNAGDGNIVETDARRQAGGRADRRHRRPAPARCSGWPSRQAAMASTTSTTAKTR